MTEYGNQFAKAIAAELRAQKARTGKTNEELADAVGVSAVTVLRYLRGQRQIPIDVFGDLCKALDVSAADITATAFNKAQGYLDNEVDPSQLPEDEKVKFVLDKIQADEQTLVASTDPYKKQEKEGGDGR